MASVTYEIVQNVATITVDNAPVNALSHAVRQGLSDAFARFENDPDARVAVVVGAGRLFLGGADISEFGKPSQPPILPDVINQIEACSKPVVAGIHGAALGGGLEVALGAHYRIARAGTKLGLPEVKLGLLPGAGGTQRLPRLVGLDPAIDMITSGAPVLADRARDIGLIDRVDTGNDICAAAQAYAQELLQTGAPVRPVSGLGVQQADELLADRRAKLAKTARGEVAALVALDAVDAATKLPFAEGLAEERRLFLYLIDTPQRAGMIHAFFAERAVAKLPEIKGVAPRGFARIGVIGGGTMGAGIATSAVLNNMRVTLVERDKDAADRAHATITRNLGSAMKRGKLDQAGYDRILNDNLRTVVGYGALSDADLVIEAVFEDMAVKKEVFAELDRVLPQGAILATNTSYLDVNEIAGATSRPADVIGLHFFSPAHIMKLLEVVVADKTAPDVTATAFALAKTLGKAAVRAGVCDGFIGNRILSHYRAAADHMVLDGASPYQIDKALTDFGFAMGPYQVSDLAGLDIGYATRQRKLATAHPRDRAPTFADALFHAGRLGQKTGRGYYIYDSDSPKGRSDPELEAIVTQARSDAGITPRRFSDDEIVHRYMAAMVNEGARVVTEGIAQRPSDVDVVFLYGYGFPRWRGGPMKYADMQGLDVILADIQGFAKDDNHFWTPAPLLTQLVAEGRNFDSLNKA
ncbi:3-hydroxyacyl-CoA dehydrogenase NAD-binding domain-containing protein [Yoonia sediminilitoris]|uniref:3-hydroxyacyl-CoA dehydrogenase n=1 Tax=Yoonia sediminilitoris TaxID=1286148 RepID=A0A2T6KR07_9RHOB|nr:3-hydroxyacyl-CoA dehydrogenase NAD-binding domain-containing protein [Yoonia sediminilitoris]PUB18989.1 3-hydroxyacyl-CoA dehydrogenase [Yoonia sediminilitoris]RCW99157.1 3-hydroxyacyl-CoA dehydrogenase [Yoonia sediminilitoris]